MAITKRKSAAKSASPATATLTEIEKWIVATSLLLFRDLNRKINMKSEGMSYQELNEAMGRTNVLLRLAKKLGVRKEYIGQSLKHPALKITCESLELGGWADGVGESW